jgi:hypothetical protein
VLPLSAAKCVQALRQQEAGSDDACVRVAVMRAAAAPQVQHMEVLLASRTLAADTDKHVKDATAWCVLFAGGVGMLLPVALLTPCCHLCCRRHAWSCVRS